MRVALLAIAMSIFIGTNTLSAINLTAPIISLATAISTMLATGGSVAVMKKMGEGKKLDFTSDKWDDFLLQMSKQTVHRYAIAIYLVAAVMSTVISYVILDIMGSQYSLEIAVLLLIGGIAVTAYNWQVKGKNYLLKRYHEIPETILDRQKRRRQRIWMNRLF